MGCHSFGDSEKQNGLVLENKLSTSTIDMGEVHYKVCLWPFANALLVLSGRLHSISQIEIVD